jgi:acyl-CoA hydrolase
MPESALPQPRPGTVAATRVEMTELVLPRDTNKYGAVFGGRVMELLDICGAIAAVRHCRRNLVTASVDHLSFLAPIKEGHIMILHSQVNAAFKHSVEVGVKVWSENPDSGDRRHVVSAFLTYAAIDELGKPASVPPLKSETAEDKRRAREAAQRRDARLALRKKD